MKSYKVRVIEVHHIERDYFVEASNKTEAKKMCKNLDWDDAHDVPSGLNEQVGVKVKSVEEDVELV
jgi:hypothetical protein